MLINKNKLLLLLIDIQEKLIGKIEDSKSLIETSVNLLEICSLLNIPVVYSVQYPKGLGNTIEVLRNKLEEKKYIKIEKTSFSCAKFKGIQKLLTVKQVLICGIETHICVLQTAFDLHQMGYEVFILDEGVGSRKRLFKEQAKDRLSNNGVSLINFEMLLFELIRDSKHKYFKTLSKYVIK